MISNGAKQYEHCSASRFKPHVSHDVLTDRYVAFPRPKHQNCQNFSKSAKLGFGQPQTKMEIYSSYMEQKKSLPSRDRTAGLKITIERDVFHQLQSCALPAELRRVMELTDQFSHDGRPNDPLIYL
jgi:uncharacterized protein (DUF885 family)